MKFDVLDTTQPALGYRFLEASAGTGKTFAIEHLVVRWIKEGLSIREILIVTFTKAATRELIERIRKRLQLERAKYSEDLLLDTALNHFDEAQIMTIHGFCTSMLSKFFIEAKCSFTFGGEKTPIWKLWLDFLRSSSLKQTFTAEEIQEFFGDQFQRKFHELIQAQRPKLQETCKDRLIAAFHEYRAGLLEKEATPEELLFAMREALQHEQFLTAVQKQYSAVVIDEFQDTDEVQWEIFSKLFSEKRILKAFCVVGDPKQSIYAFRNADLYTYFSAKEQFSIEETATLQVNYRSEEPLVSALNALFTCFGQKDWMRLPKWNRFIEVIPVHAGKPKLNLTQENSPLHIVIAKENELKLYHYIVKMIRFWTMQGVLPREIAILVKNRFEARDLIHFLQKKGIKAHYSSRGQLAETRVFEAVVDFISLLEKPRDKARLKLVLAGVLVGQPLKYLQEGNFDLAYKGLQHLLIVLEEKGLIACLEEFFDGTWLGEISIAERLLQEDDLESFEEFRQIADLLIEQTDLKQALLFLNRLREEKTFGLDETEKRSSMNDETIEITTIFQSKGLEYEIVFPLGLATDRKRKEDDEERIAEKMRLFYVALTRAKRCVYLPWLIEEKQKDPSITEQFFSFGKDNILSQLRNIPNACIEEIDLCEESQMISASENREIPPPSSFEKTYPIRLWTSFSSLAKEEVVVKKILPQEAKEESLPAGAKTGKEIHAILQNIFEKSWHYPYNPKEICRDMKEEIFTMIDAVFHLPIIPLKNSKDAFTLKDVPKNNLSPEMEFVYEKGKDLIKGFIDLVFFYDGLYYIVDWKTNWLPEYSEETIEESMLQHQYHLQAKIYKEALERYVKLFDSRPFDQVFGGAYYLYLRGKQWKSFLP